MIVRKRGDWLAATVADEVLMMNADNGLYLGLNPVGARIWQMIDTPCDVDTLCAHLEHEFDVTPETCRAEVDAFLNQLARHRAIDIEPQPEIHDASPMSGIFGILRHDGGQVSQGDLARMAAILAHRARDDRGSLALGPIGLGHGLTCVNAEDFHEAQPLADPANGLVLVADLRLDNRTEIAAQANTDGDLSEIPDSALLLAAYRIWGDACVEHLVGDFAFALWDGKRRILLLARDHMGQRGLFYHHSANFTVFASEARALWAVEGVPRRLCEDAIGRQLLYPIEPNAGTTLYDGISQLPGATLLRIGADGTVDRQQYWEPHAATQHLGRDEAYYVERYRTILEEAVACRVRRLTRAPGLLFSGGFDSGSIAVLAGPIVAGQGRRIVAVASVLGEDKPAAARDARAASLAFADRDWLDLHFYVRGEEGFFTDLETSFLRAEESAGTPYVRQALYRMAAAGGARLVLDGMGGDYTLHVRAPAMLGRMLRSGHVLRYVRELRARRRVTGRPWRALLLYETLPALLPLKMLAAIAFVRRGCRPIWRARAARTAFARALFARGTLDPRRLRQPEQVHNRWRERWLHLLRKSSAAPPSQSTLAASLGLDLTRPFHDKRVVEFALAIPDDLHLKQGMERYLARRAIGDLLPRRLLDRPPGNDPEEPDLFAMAWASAAEELAKARALDRNGRLSRFVDFDRIERLIANPNERKMADHARLHIATRAIALARFIAWFERDNG